MDRTQMYPYVKMYPLRIFHGSLRIQCDLKERGLWYELVFWAKICQVAEIFPANDVVDHDHVEKLISANETTPYPREYMAQFLGVDLEWLENALTRLKDQRRIREDERGIWIINWEKYQPEYDRQSIYRDKGKPERDKFKKSWANAPICPECKVNDHMDRSGDGKDVRATCSKCGTVLVLDKYSAWTRYSEDEVSGKKKKASTT